MTRAEIVEEARRWLDVPYVDMGRSKSGLDCLGLLVMIGRHFDVPYVDEPFYTRWPRHDRLIMRKLDEFLIRMPPRASRPGLVGLFATRQLPTHVGIFSEKFGALHLIHARVTPPRVMEEAFEQMPAREIRQIAQFRLPGMVD